MTHGLEGLRQNWFIILFLGGVIVGWTTFSIRLASAEAQVKELSGVIGQIGMIQSDIAVLKARTADNYIQLQVKNGVAEALLNYEIQTR